MVKFIDGPAAGKVLSLRRLPKFLRVVKSAAGIFDALDALEDVPAADETIYAYKLKSNDGGAFVDGRDPKTGKRTGGFRAIGSYTVVPDEAQPVDTIMRSMHAWQVWCVTQG